MAFDQASSSQQPLATPQPAPTHSPAPAISQAASPPTKASLKSWWKGFRPPTKSHDTPGNYFSSPKDIQSEAYFSSSAFVSQLSKNRNPLFRESVMNESASVIDGQPVLEEASQASVLQPTTPITPERRAASSLGSKERNSSTQGSSSHFGSSLQVSPTSVNHASSHIFTPQSNSRITAAGSVFSRGRVSTADHTSDNIDMGAGILPGPNIKPTSSHLFSGFFSIFRPNSSKEKAKKSSKAAERPTGIFGVPLRQSITYANVAISLVDAEGKSYVYGYVPIVVAKCGVYLKEKATNVEGIFRLSGSEKRIKDLKALFDTPDRFGKGLDWDGYTVHDAANVLRRYLNQLPEPIVPLDLYEKFRDPLRGHTQQAVGDTEGPQLDGNFDIGNAISTYQQLITELPPLNRQLLLYILDLLAVFASKAEENRMNSQNLAAIFQPGMLTHPTHDMVPSEYRLSQDVLIFLIENQDHFLIGMKGTAADDGTVTEVQNGGISPPGTPITPGKSKVAIGRSASNASAGADSVRKFGGIRRNVSVSSRHSRQSNGAPSPASPVPSQSASGGVHRSNTLPSKRSPGLPQNRLQKNSGSPLPNAAGIFSSQQVAPRGLSPAAPTTTTRTGSPSSPTLPTVMGSSGLAPSVNTAPAIASQERLLGEQKLDAATPTKEKTFTSIFQRSPTMDSEKRPANKLRKKRIPSSSNPSAQSSTHSLNSPQYAAASPYFGPIHGHKELAEHPQLESIPSATPELSNTDATPPATDTPRAEIPPVRTQEHAHHPSENTLKPAASPPSSLHSRSSYNDQSDADHHEDAAEAAEQQEKRSRWRLSRRDDSRSNTLSPKKGLGTDSNVGASSSSVGSTSRPKKSFTGDTVPVSSDSTLVGTHQQSSNDSGTAGHSGEEKKGPLGWIKNKMREKRNDKEAEKERTKSPPASTERIASTMPLRGKSVDIKRDGNAAIVSEKEPIVPQS